MMSQLEAQFSSLSLDPKPLTTQHTFSPIEYLTAIPSNLSNDWLSHLICCYSKAEHRNLSFLTTQEGFELKPLNTKISQFAKVKSKIVLEGIYVSSLCTIYIYDVADWNDDYREYPYELRLFLLKQKLSEIEFQLLRHNDTISCDLEVKLLNIRSASPEQISILEKSETPQEKDTTLFSSYQAYLKLCDFDIFITNLRRDTHLQKFLSKGLLFFHKESRALTQQLVKREFVQTSSQGYFSAMLWVDVHYNFRTSDNVIVYRSSLIDYEQWKIDPNSLYHVLYEGLEQCVIQGQNTISLSKMILVAKLQVKRNKPSSFSELIYKHQVALNIEVKIAQLCEERLDEYFNSALSLK